MPQDAAAERKPRAALTPPGIRLRFFWALEFDELTGINEMKGVVSRIREMKKSMLGKSYREEFCGL
jgi:hypothetical protein